MQNVTPIFRTRPASTGTICPFNRSFDPLVLFRDNHLGRTEFQLPPPVSGTYRFLGNHGGTVIWWKVGG